MNELLSLQDLFNKKIFRIPDYQRGYSWEELQLKEFWSDLLNLLPDRDHYTGMISLKKLDSDYVSNEKWNDEKWLIENWGYVPYHVVDGQQRLTTFIILINEIVSYYIKNNPDKSLNEIFINSIPLSKIQEDYLVQTKPDSQGTVKTYKFGYEVDNPSYQFFKYRILEPSNPVSVDETFYTLNLAKSKQFFEAKIKELVESKGIHELENIFKKVTQRLKFNMYYIDNDFNVFIAFETMNNRGKRLSYLELLKNRLIYLSTVFDCPEDSKIAVRNNINETWKTVYEYLGKNKTKPLNDNEFLQAHWMIYFGYTRSNKVTYDSFLLNDYFTQQNISNDYNFEITEDDAELSLEDEENEINESIKEEKVQAKKEKLTIGTINNYINSMKALIPYWYQIHFPHEIENKDIKMYIERLNRLGYVNFKPLATVLLSKNSLTEQQKIDVLKGMERFVFLHYRLNGYFGTYKNSFFYNLAHDYYTESVTYEKVLNEVRDIDYLSDNKVANMNGINTKFDRLFKNNNGFYSWASIRYVLYEYERHLMKGLSSSVRLLPEDIFKKDEKDHYSIEHIYPQTPTDEYWIEKYNMYSDSNKHKLTNTIGNLLPLSKTINSALQNYAFSKKKEMRFCDGSHNELEVSRNEKWTSEEILNRGLKILEFMEEEWDFIIPNLAERKRFLGLDFMIEEDDEYINSTEPINIEEVKPQKEIIYNEEQFNRLISKTNDKLKNIFMELDEYIMTLNCDIKKNTTSVYLSYFYGQNFIELWFNANSLKYVLNTGEYNDPNQLVGTLAESYQWVHDRYIVVTEDSDLEYIKFILRQSYDKQCNK